MKQLMLILLSFALLLGCVQDTGSTGASDSMENDSMSDGGDALAAGGIPYVPYTKAAYESAKADGKIVFLEFYANWCPICADQETELVSAFESLDYDNIAAFRVNYKDSDTDDDEKNLAREFGVTIQHTHIIVGADGETIKRSSESWDKDRIISEIENARGA